MMSAWLRVRRGPYGDFMAPADVGPDGVCFVENTSEIVSWGRCYPARDADVTAAREWVVTAQAVSTAIHREAVVVGEGALAALVRLALSPNSTDPGGTPFDVAVETTGTPAGITAALQSVRPGGSVVLAARPLCTATPLRTYRDVHRPGVRLVPIAWACDDIRSARDDLLAWALENLIAIEFGRPAPPGSWYRLVVGGHA